MSCFSVSQLKLWNHSGASGLVKQESTADCAEHEQGKLLIPREGRAAAHIKDCPFSAKLSPGRPHPLQVFLLTIRAMAGNIVGASTAGQYSLLVILHILMTSDTYH